MQYRLTSALAVVMVIVAELTGTEVMSQETKNISGILHNINYGVEMQATMSHNKTPLWLNANKYGLSSLDETNGYLRASLSRPLSADSAYRWGMGWGADLAVPYNFTSNFVIQQAYVEGRWLKGTLTVGSREWKMELKNNELSSGSQTLGRNARPVPQVRVALPDYWEIPFTRGWLSLKGHIAYGMMTDDNWQHDVTGRRSRYADNVLYHSKAGYLRIGNDYRFCPVSLELGLEMASTFGGTAYRQDTDGSMVKVENATNLRALWQAFMPGGAEANETMYKNIEGNHVGSWLIRFNYKADRWGLSVYADKFFEDQSSMFQLDYNGYGEGEEWDQKKKRKYILYDFKDIMLGMELNMDYEYWIQNVVLEYMYTKYQSGPVYHDRTISISDHVGGKDDFYNHSVFTGWQHWGQVMGNPLYRSPIYNSDGTIMVENNRFMAFHLGISSTIRNFHYRLLGTWQDGLGTYLIPFTKKQQNVSLLAEATYRFAGKLEGWSLTGACGADFGKILGDNSGFQLTIAKKGILR